ncbi:MAG: serine hydrolase domain-containing protein, partial [Thermoanaerobaculia bacterium]
MKNPAPRRREPSTDLSLGVLLLACLFLGCASAKLPLVARPAAPPSGNDPRLAHLLEEQLKTSGVPALAAALITTDAPLRAAVVGVREAGRDQPAERNDLFHIGSCTKPMTADLIATLVEEGRIKWSSRLVELLPDLAAVMRPEYREVTVEQVLSHRAGLPAYTEIDDAEFQRLAALGGGEPVAARRALAAEVLQKAPVARPGTETHYSNAGYAIAASAVERLTGKPWEQLIKERIFKPLGMSSCSFGFPATTVRPQQPRG